MKRKSVAQLRNELNSSVARLKDIDIQLKALKSGEVDGNTKKIEKKIKDLTTEQIKLKHAKKDLEEELENIEII